MSKDKGKKRKPQSDKKKQGSEPVLDMIHMLELDREPKITKFHMLRDLMQKVDNMQWVT